MQGEEFWRLVQEHAARAARGAARPFVSFAVTTGDASTTDTVESVTVTQVAVWLDGVDQVADNKVNVILPYGQADPGAGELWLVLLPNYEPPGVLLTRLA